MATITREDVLNYLESATMMDVAKLVEEIEEKFGVTAAAPVAVAAVGAAGGDAGAAEEKTDFDVVLKEVGSQKIQVIKVVRAITGLGLKEAKEVVEAAPKAIKEGIEKAEAEELKKQLEEVGAVAEVA